MSILLSNSKSSVELIEKDGQVLLKEIKFADKTFIKDESGYFNTLAFILGEAYQGKQFHRYQKRGENLKYASHEIIAKDGKKTLVIIEKNDKIQVKTYISLLDDIGVIEVYKDLENISEKTITLECLCPLAFTGVMNYNDDENSSELPYFFKPHNTWCTEVNFEKIDLNKEGMRAYKDFARRDTKYCVSNNGTQTTNRYLPMGVLEKNGYGYLAFEIEPKGCWSYEMEIVDKADRKKDFAVIITGKTLEDNGWYKEIKSGETYSTEKVRLTGNADLDGVLEELTLFRRKIKVQHKVKAHEFVIYNNFQHNTWDNPTEQSDSIHIECASDCGADYYVVDAGWHDGRIDGHSPTQAIGRWFESKTNYPSGFIKTVEKARAFGMKFGLWMEIQSFGVFCEEPNLLSEDCFAHINGVRPIGNNRYHLDYTNEKVRDYFDKVFERVINDYNPDYIKVDYNQTLIGKDCEGGSISEGVCQQYSAYEEWFLALQRRYPDIIFETCSSGGMRNDAAIGRYSNVVSASDQGDYKAYPYIVANLPMSLLPEQSGIWNIAISFWKPETDREKIAFNTINSLFGVMHLSSKLDLVNDELREIIREGGKYYKELAKIKETAIPVMPNGFTAYDAKVVFAGLKTKEKLYLSVWNLSNETKTIKQDLSKYGVKNAKISFPSFAENKFSLNNGVLEIVMDGETARMIELDV